MLFSRCGKIDQNGQSHILITPQEFVYKGKRVTACEKQTYQERFLDICQLVGHQTPNNYDPTCTPFAFEMGAAKRTLTNLYNAHTTWLELAPKKLDQAVFAAYG